jgi:hypothetical protein
MGWLWLSVPVAFVGAGRPCGTGEPGAITGFGAARTWSVTSARRGLPTWESSEHHRNPVTGQRTTLERHELVWWP